MNPDYGKQAWEVKDDDVDELRAKVVGCTIVAIDREPSTPGDWNTGENPVAVLLDDGSVLYFEGYGYDASGLTTCYVSPEDARAERAGVARS